MEVQHKTSLPRFHKHLNHCFKNSFESVYSFHIKITDFKNNLFVSVFSAMLLFCFGYLFLVVQGLGRSNGRFVALERKFKSVGKINVYRKTTVLLYKIAALTNRVIINRKYVTFQFTYLLCFCRK